MLLIKFPGPLHWTVWLSVNIHHKATDVIQYVSRPVKRNGLAHSSYISSASSYWIDPVEYSWDDKLPSPSAVRCLSFWWRTIALFVVKRRSQPFIVQTNVVCVTDVHAAAGAGDDCFHGERLADADGERIGDITLPGDILTRHRHSAVSPTDSHTNSS